MSVDKVLIQFDSDIKELRKDMSKAKSDIKGVEKQAKKSSSNLTQSFKNVGAAIVAAFSVQQIIQFTKKSVELYNIQAKAEAALLQALKGREDVQRRLIRQAQDLQKVTLFGDEETIRAQAMLAKFGLLESQIRRMMPLIQDYATITGQDLVSAADMVARSIGSSTNALVRYGIEIEGAAGSNERLESAVEALNKQVGGQAVAAAEAGTGALQQYQNAWGDLAEMFGEVVTPALTKVFGGIVNFLELMLLARKSVTQVRDEVRAMQGDENFTREQDLFIDWLNESKDRYGNLEQSAEAYLKTEREILAEYGKRMRAGEQLTSSEENVIESYMTQIEAVEEYVRDVQAMEMANINAAKSMDGLAKASDGVKDALARIPDVVKESKPQDVLDWEAWQKTLDAIAEENAKFWSGYIDGYDDGLEANIAFFEGIEQQRQDDLDRQEAWKDAAFDISRSLFGGMEDLSSQQTNKYIKDLERQLAAGEITEAEFEKMRKDRLRKAAKEQKAFSILTIVLNTAEAVMNALTSKPAAAAPALAAAAGIAGAVQLGLAMNAPLPQFAEGVIDLNGPGTATSDSILARLSKGESVITAEATRRDKGLLEAINKLETDEYINRSWVLPALQKQEAERREMFDDYRLYRTLRDGQLRSSKDIDRVVDAIQSSRRNLRHVV